MRLLKSIFLALFFLLTVFSCQEHKEKNPLTDNHLTKQNGPHIMAPTSPIEDISQIMIRCTGNCSSEICLTSVSSSVDGNAHLWQCSCTNCVMEARIDGVVLDDPSGAYAMFNGRYLFLNELSDHVHGVYGTSQYGILSIEYLDGGEHYALLYEVQTDSGDMGTVLFMHTADGKKYKVDCIGTQCDCRERFIPPNKFECTCQEDCSMMVETLGDANDETKDN